MLTASVQFFLLYFSPTWCWSTRDGRHSAAGGQADVGRSERPLLGWLSDRTRSVGVGPPYMLLSGCRWPYHWYCIRCIGHDRRQGFLIVSFSYLLFDTMHTAVSTAYSPSLGADYDYDERTSLTTVRMVFSVIGYILGQPHHPDRRSHERALEARRRAIAPWCVLD